MSEDTTVRVRHATWRRLNDRKDPGVSFDEVISNLLDAQEADEAEGQTPNQ